MSILGVDEVSKTKGTIISFFGTDIVGIDTFVLVLALTDNTSTSLFGLK